MDCRSRHHAYSLVELLLVLCIAGLLLLLAVPSFANLLLDNQRRTAINDLVAHFHYARSQAVKENGWAIICKSPDQRSCTSSGGWEQGWLVFPDRNKNRSRDLEEPILASHPPLTKGSTLEYRAFGSNNYVIYRHRGDSTSNGTFTHCDRRGSDSARAMILYRSGRVRTSDKSASGNPLGCP